MSDPTAFVQASEGRGGEVLQRNWPGFKYEQVPGLANRFISRYLRTQRKNMLRFFQERGLYKLADRMKQIRNSKQGMLAKNRMFQEVLNSYAKLTTPIAYNEGSVVPGAVLQQSSPFIEGESEA
jgi:hypothetical protein